jgi:hypothetical protein
VVEDISGPRRQRNVSRRKQNAQQDKNGPRNPRNALFQEENAERDTFTSRKQRNASRNVDLDTHSTSRLENANKKVEDTSVALLETLITQPLLERHSISTKLEILK